MHQAPISRAEEIDYFSFINGDVQFSPQKEQNYLEILNENTYHMPSKPRTVRSFMAQMRQHVEDEIKVSGLLKLEKSKLKYELNLSVASQDERLELPGLRSTNNQFLQYKLRRTPATEGKNKTARAVTQDLRMTQTDQVFDEKTTARLSQVWSGMKSRKEPPQQQRYQQFLRINKQLKQGLESGYTIKYQMAKLLHQKIQIAEEILRNNKHHNSVNMQNTLQQLKYKLGIFTSINRLVFDQCEQIQRNSSKLDASVKQDYYQNYQRRTRIQGEFLELLKQVETIDDYFCEVLLDYKIKNKGQEDNQTLDDIHQMKEDAYNLKVRNFSKYHDIDQEKKRELSRRRRLKHSGI